MNTTDEKNMSNKMVYNQDGTAAPICSVCGKPWSFSYKIVYNQDGTVICYHDDEAFGQVTTEDEKYNKRLMRRARLLAEHNKGKLPKSYYKKSKDTGKMALLPSYLKKLGY